MISIRQLQPSDAEMFRDLRLEALQASPGAFSSSFEREKDLPLSRWRELLAAPDGAVFGLFDGTAMIGLTAIYTDRKDSSGETAALAMSYVRPSYRGQGLSALFYDARLAWSRAQPDLRRVRVGHRASNEASRRAILRHGFVLTGRSNHLWPDGVAEDHLHYELLLR